MRNWGRWLGATLVLALAAGRAHAGDADPEEGRVADGSYRNPYFGLTYPLPPGWSEDRAGPKPSKTGAYVLAALTTREAPKATLQFGAQDLFFAATPPATALAAAQALRASLSAIEGMAIEREPGEITIGNRRFARFDYSGAGLFHAYFAIELRCHLVSATATATDPAALAQIATSLDALSIKASDDSAPPTCVKDFAGPGTVQQQVTPSLTGPKFTKIPVRIVVEADGTIGHTHVINALPDQRAAIVAALTQWRFSPYRQDGEARPVETGLAFEVK
jgi:hypothetical protein